MPIWKATVVRIVFCQWKWSKLHISYRHLVLTYTHSHITVIWYSIRGKVYICNISTHTQRVLSFFNKKKAFKKAPFFSMKVWWRQVGHTTAWYSSPAHQSVWPLRGPYCLHPPSSVSPLCVFLIYVFWFLYGTHVKSCDGLLWPDQTTWGFHRQQEKALVYLCYHTSRCRLVGTRRSSLRIYFSNVCICFLQNGEEEKGTIH